MFSSDGVDAPDALAGLAASAAIAVSDVPFEEPIAEVRVARIDGEFVIDPTFEQIEKADMELMVGATYDNIMMVEGERGHQAHVPDPEGVGQGAGRCQA